ncbi:DNA repair protein RecN [Alteromonas sp. 5E99-2]|uniref:DNA repair protein RecN n=1 Tax=Alteromonas sp. 5E99-2 TaxID=2817683 RepID=UPI001A980402|nr:DNA repair protein RecN [Alteromonas sp. 5E99-2]MBO1255443.1 DNA repair protein RecN [Alteromonas sp. 5E99-2]
MLIHLSIKNFAVVKQLELNLEQGLTAITGETGAGKSIAIDALGLCIGDRADASSVRVGAEKAEIVAHHSLVNCVNAKIWLEDNAMLSEDEPDTCFIRRVISKEGRSKAFINGSAASLAQLKELGIHLLSIHGQNTHLALLKEDVQRTTLDNFANHPKLMTSVANFYSEWKSKQQQLQKLEDEKLRRADRQQLLSYQVKELDEFAIEDGEFEKLEAEHKRLSYHQHLVEQSEQSLHLLYDADQHAALSVVQQQIDSLSDLIEHDGQLTSTVSLLQESAAQLEEAIHELRHYTDSLDADPQRFAEIESRFSLAVSLARKHQIQPEALYSYHQTLSNELATLSADEETLTTLKAEVALAKTDYLKQAKKLSTSRQKAAKAFSASLLDYVAQMNMPHAQITLKVSFDENAKASALGLDKVSILISVNPGQPQGPLDKVLSGGELSRVGLAVQVISLSEDAAPTLIFDEVDTGISGPTASIVGQLLKRLGQDQQVLCVTHLPQVAAQAHNQLFVSKLTNGTQTETNVLPLTPQDRIHELARLLAGDTVTESAIENAKELLKQAEQVN